MTISEKDLYEFLWDRLCAGEFENYGCGEVGKEDVMRAVTALLDRFLLIERSGITQMTYTRCSLHSSEMSDADLEAISNAEVPSEYGYLDTELLLESEEKNK